MTNVKTTTRFKDTLVISGITIGLVVLLPVLAAIGLVLQLGFVAAVPLAALAILLVPPVRSSLRGGGHGSDFTVKGVALHPRAYHHEHHIWLRRLGRGRYAVGIDDLLQRALGPIEDVSLPGEGTVVSSGDPLVTLRRGDRELVIRAPAAGTVRAVNGQLAESPGLVNEDPYEQGWILELSVDDPGNAVEGLRGVDTARYWMQSEIDRLASIISGPVNGAPVLADGGELPGELWSTYDAQTWERLREEMF